MLVLLSMSFYSVLNFEKLIYNYEQQLPDFTCSTETFKNVNTNAALDDYKLQPEKRNGDWHCFCSNAKDDMTQEEFSSIIFTDPYPSGDGKAYCDGTQCRYCDYWNSLNKFIFTL